MTGRTLGHYRIEAKLGEGGMGVVYKALDTHLDRFVAIKVLPPETVADAEKKRRFVQEAKAASALNHPNIITIHDINTDAGIDFIAMEYVPGRTLDRLLGQRGLPLRDALQYAIQISDALAAAHEAGIIHRDLKPGNIIVTDQGHVKLLDFGLAKLTEANSDELAPTQTIRPHTEEGKILGTVAYMSPEQAQGKKLDARSDIFSFGVVLYEMLCGQRPFPGGSAIETLSAIIQKEPKPVTEMTSEVPRDLERIVALALRKQPERRFQHMADVKIQLQALKEESDSGKLTAAPDIARPRARWRMMVAGAALLAVVAVGAILWWIYRPRPAAQSPTLTRLTSDSGLTTDPALSPDGKLLAFASDRSGAGRLNIWVRQVAGGEPIRVTDQSGDDSEPAFSPDGSQIVFRSETDGGGIYVIPALGGEPRLIAKSGRRPRFSPDGKRIAYWTGEQHNPFGDIYVVAATGGVPRKLQFRPPLAMAKCPIWSPDGSSLLFIASEGREGKLDWWTASVDDGVAAKTGAFDVFRGQKLPTSIYVIPGEWRNDRVVFSAMAGDSTALWQASIPLKSPQVTEAARQLTFSTGLHSNPSMAAGGQLAFVSLTENVDVWSLPADAKQGKATGEPQRLTRDAAVDLHPSITADGRKMVFRSNRSGNMAIWMKDLETGRETRLTLDPLPHGMPLIASDGSRIVFQSWDGGKESHSFLTAGPRGYSGAGEKVCDDGCGFLSEVSSDGSLVLGYQPARGTVSAVDVRSAVRRIIVRGDSGIVLDPRLSADGRWVAFHTGDPVGGNITRRQIFVAPVRLDAPALSSEWIPITDGSAMDRFPTFSLDGNLLYFISERDGFRCIAAQRLDPASKRPSGSMFYVYHFHASQRSMMHFQNPNWSRLSVARDRIVFSLTERSGNIWMMQLSDLN